MRNAWARALSRSRGSRRAALALAQCLLAFVVLSGIAQSGARYFYCEAIGLSLTDPCAQSSREPGPGDPCGSLREQAADCCEIVTLPTLPEGARASSPSIPPATSVALIPALWLARAAALTDPPSRTRVFERWRLPPPPSNELHARLMVFLT